MLPKFKPGDEIFIKGSSFFGTDVFLLIVGYVEYPAYYYLNYNITAYRKFPTAWIDTNAIKVTEAVKVLYGR